MGTLAVTNRRTRLFHETISTRRFANKQQSHRARLGCCSLSRCNNVRQINIRTWGEEACLRGYQSHCRWRCRHDGGSCLPSSRHHQGPDATLSKSSAARREKRGFITTGMEIARKETPLGLYKGLGAVLTGIIPKMAIRFTSYESYKQMLAGEDGKIAGSANFMAGLAAGVTEAVAVVTPMEVVKIRLQSQYHSMSDPLDVPKYRNAAHACF